MVNQEYVGSNILCTLQHLSRAANLSRHMAQGGAVRKSENSSRRHVISSLKIQGQTLNNHLYSGKMEHTEWRILRFVSIATGLKCRKQYPLLQPNPDTVSSKLGFSNLHIWRSVNHFMEQRPIEAHTSRRPKLQDRPVLRPACRESHAISL